ncbi:arginase [Paenibacillus sp. N1-5-1-14]|uniref:arginase n=1 Tax=Paenibacillus radicibacter TaxID=2972488 RepID=UPI002159A4DF|nr:arginase [Paenibacillus radicibacter]MCR8645552.1 arginase [Paenibacillus radicibacter]
MSSKIVSILRVPFGLGGARPGAHLGPEALIDAGLIRHLSKLPLILENEGEVAASIADPIPSETGHTKLKHLQEIVAVNTELAARVSSIVDQGKFPLVLGGDHSIAIGTIAGLTQHYKNIGIIWFDAHGDLNTEDTSPTGNIHGMSLAVNLGRGHELLTHIKQQGSNIDPKKVVIIGARQLDDGEKAWIRSSGITCFTMHDIDRLGMSHVITEALRIVGQDTDGVHLSFDIDSLDPYEAPGTGTAVQGGVNYREAHFALEMMAESGLITSAEFVEVNPLLDSNNRTVRLTNELICSLMGQRIL